MRGAAAVLMVLMRMLQASRSAGEYTSIVYLAETRPPTRSVASSPSWTLFGAVGGNPAAGSGVSGPGSAIS